MDLYSNATNGNLSPIEVLEEIVNAVDGRMKIFIDGGFVGGGIFSNGYCCCGESLSSQAS